MVIKKHRRSALVVVLCSLAFAVACVSGSADDAGNDSPECYTNTDCPGGRECSGGICVGYTSCGNGCRNNEDCLDNVCRLQCTKIEDCEDQGLTCGTIDTKHCKPKQNPSRSQTQTQGGTGGTGGTGSGGSGTAGRPAGAAGTAAAAGGTPGVAGAGAAAGGPPVSTAGSGS